MHQLIVALRILSNCDADYRWTRGLAADSSSRCIRFLGMNLHIQHSFVVKFVVQRLFVELTQLEGISPLRKLSRHNWIIVRRALSRVNHQAIVNKLHDDILPLEALNVQFNFEALARHDFNNWDYEPQ